MLPGTGGELGSGGGVAPADGGAADVTEEERPTVGGGADLLAAGGDDGPEQGLAALVDDGDDVADGDVDVVHGDAKAAEVVAILQVVGEGGVVVDTAGPQARALPGRGDGDVAGGGRPCLPGGAGVGRPGRRRRARRGRGRGGDGGRAGQGRRLLGPAAAHAGTGGVPDPVGVAAEPAAAGVGGRRRGGGGAGRRRGGTAGGVRAGAGCEEHGGGEGESGLLRHAGWDGGGAGAVPGNFRSAGLSPGPTA